jgi:hypothetical protein
MMSLLMKLSSRNINKCRSPLHLSFQDAKTIGVGIMTAGLLIYHALN